MNAAIERGLSQALEQELAKEVKPNNNRQPAIDEQLLQFERIGKSIKNRLRNERLVIVAEYERTKTELKSDFERKASEILAKLTEERDQALQQLSDTVNQRLHELDMLAERVDHA